MAAPIGLHPRGLPSLVYRWRCVFACTGAATAYHTSTPACLYTFTVVCTSQCVCVCVCVCIMTVILYDRMITPVSPQLRGASLLLSSPSTSPQRSYVLPHMSKPVPLWAAALLCISVSPPSARPCNLGSVSSTKQLNQQKSSTEEHTDPMT